MPIVRLPNGDLRDEIRQPLYDTISIAGGAAGLTSAVGTSVDSLNGKVFFQNIQGKAQWQTNLRQPSALETAVSFRVQGMTMDAQYYNADSAGNKNDLLFIFNDYSSMNLKIGEKIYWTGPCLYLMGRLRLDVAAGVNQGPAPGASALLTRQYIHAGQQVVQGVVLSGRHVVDINPLQNFAATMLTAVPTGLVADSTFGGGSKDALNLKLSLKGLQRRPVQ